MYGNHRLALMGASALSAAAGRFDIERKETGNLDVETKKAVDELGTLFKSFRDKNDAALEELKKGREDAVTKDELKKIGDAFEATKSDVQKQLDEIFKKANRAGLGGDPEAVAEAKAAKIFGELVGKSDFSAENLAEYKSAVSAYLRRDVKAQTMQVGQDPAGGYWVTPDTTGRMVQKIYESTPMRQIANVVTIGTDKLEGAVDNGEGDAAWVGEVTTRAQTDTPQIGKWEIPVHELYAYPKVTQRLLEDAQIDVEAWLANKSTSKFARKENNAFLVGNGVNKPRGLLDYSTSTTADATRAWEIFQYIATGSDGSFGATTNGTDKLLELIYELKAEYRQSGRFLMARRTVGGVRKLKGGDGNYAYGISLRDGALVENIFGYGITEGEDMSAFTTTGALAIAFGDFAEAYTIVDRLGVSVVRDNITQPGFVKYHMRKRVGGGATNFEAVKFLKFGAS